MRKFIALLILITLPLGVVFSGGASDTSGADDGTIRIGVSKLLSHAALDAVEEGMQEYLATTGLPITYDFQNAQGDISTSASIAQKFKDDNCDIVVGIATPTAQALVNVFHDIPVLFAAVTDPVDAGLVATYDPDPNTNVAGVSDMNPVEAQIKLLMDITGAKVIGNIYASGEANGVTLMNQAKAATEKLGGTFVEAAVANSAEVMMAAQSIIDRVDAVYIATDNTVISALSAVASVTSANNKPLFAADPSGVYGLDFLISWGFDYHQIGVELGKAIEKIINGTPAGEIGTIFLTDPSDFELWFNLDEAEKLGVTIPSELLDSAVAIVQNGELIRK